MADFEPCGAARKGFLVRQAAGQRGVDRGGGVVARKAKPLGNRPRRERGVGRRQQPENARPAGSGAHHWPISRCLPKAIAGPPLAASRAETLERAPADDSGAPSAGTGSRQGKAGGTPASAGSAIAPKPLSVRSKVDRCDIAVIGRLAHQRERSGGRASRRQGRNCSRGRARQEKVVQCASS